MIRLPIPNNIDNIIIWARRVVSAIEIQQKTTELSSSTAINDAEEQAESMSWFNG